jgi:hypothetical protein
MLWFFECDDESLTIETRYDNDTSEIVVIVHYPDGHEDTERFANGDECRLWLEAFEQTLAAQNWTGRGGPIILPYGWPKRLM